MFHTLNNTVSQRVVRAQQQSLVRYGEQVLVKHLLAVHYRAYLQQVELSRLIGMDVTSHLYLHRTSHLFLTKAQRHLHQFWQGPHLLLKHSIKRYNLTSALIEPRSYYLIIGIKGGSYIL